jgi:acetylornithine deacetylase/succinyl-diaminopimelate desuccinylase-like protein
MTELTTLIQQLVRIDSVNPALDPAHPGEEQIARFVATWTRRWWPRPACLPVLFVPIGSDIHQPTEWLDLDSVESMLEILGLVIERYCG